MPLIVVDTDGGNKPLFNTYKKDWWKECICLRFSPSTSPTHHSASQNKWEEKKKTITANECQIQWKHLVPASTYIYMKPCKVSLYKIYGSLQIFLPKSLQPRTLRLSHYSRLARHQAGRRMYDTMRQELYWPNISNDVYQVAQDFRSYTANRGTIHRHQKKRRLFTAADLSNQWPWIC